MQFHYVFGNDSKAFSAGNMKKVEFYECVYDFSIDCDSTDVADNLDIHKYLMVKTNIKQCLDVSKKYSLDH